MGQVGGAEMQYSQDPYHWVGNPQTRIITTAKVLLKKQ